MATASVRKYPLKLAPKQIIKLEDDAVVLPGVYSRWGEPVLYVIGQHKQTNVKHTVKMFITADKFGYDPVTMKFLGVFHNADECHFFFDILGE